MFKNISFSKHNIRIMKMKTTNWDKIFAKHIDDKLLFLGIEKSITTIVDKPLYTYIYI